MGSISKKASVAQSLINWRVFESHFWGVLRILGILTIFVYCLHTFRSMLEIFNAIILAFRSLTFLNSHDKTDLDLDCIEVILLKK